MVDDVRNFLFGTPGTDGFDLAALNIQRGRDHGLPGYNDLREALQLPRRHSFASITSDPIVQTRLALAYASPDDVDPWVGGLAEDPFPGGHVGELIRAILIRQFTALRDGDRYWYAHSLATEEIRQVEALRLSDIIRLNTDIADELPDDVFHVVAGVECTKRLHGRPQRGCSEQTSTAQPSQHRHPGSSNAHATIDVTERDVMVAMRRGLTRKAALRSLGIAGIGRVQR